MNSNKIQFWMLIVSLVTLFSYLLFQFWDLGVSSLLIIVYGLIYILFVLVGFLYFEIYGKDSKGVRL